MGASEAKVAITGGVAEGKSTVLSFLKDLGYRTASSDAIAKEVFDTDEVQVALAQILDCRGPVSPDLLRQRIWAEPGVRLAVNRLMHPRILNLLYRSGAQFIEVPLLIETCLQGEFDRVWVVTCGREEQLRRLTERLGDEKQADEVIASQLSSEVKLAFADVIVRTNRPLADVKRFVAAMAGRSVSQ